jgi:hypothetical protein
LELKAEFQLIRVDESDFGVPIGAVAVPYDRLLVWRLSDSSGHLPARGEPSEDEPVADADRSTEAPSSGLLLMSSVRFIYNWTSSRSRRHDDSALNQDAMISHRPDGVDRT